MSAPSDKAVGAAERDLATWGDGRSALEAAHSPALGLDRSVCLRDVIEAVEDAAAEWTPFSKTIRTTFERRFAEGGE